MPTLLTSTDCTSHVHLIVGHNPLASTRANHSLSLGARVKLFSSPDSPLHYGLQQKITEGLIDWIQKPTVTYDDLTTLGRPEVEGVVDAVFVTLSVGSPQSHQIFKMCQRLRVPINVSDTPALCTFTLLSTYADGPLQIGVTTTGRGCKLASRIKREIVAGLPKGLGQACERFGKVRRRVWEEDYESYSAQMEELEGMEGEEEGERGERERGRVSPDEDEDIGQTAAFNKLVSYTQESYEAAKSRRIRWLSQVCEYWPLGKLCSLTDEDIETVLKSYTAEKEASAVSDLSSSTNSTLSLDPTLRRRGKILLVGSGPGHPDLLTTASLKAIQTADVILADKLVPAPVLSLIPRRTPVHIARKFPGNADKAQEELLEMGYQALLSGQTVVRLKQGDPYIYGRGAEEVEFFRSKGWEPVVLPGVTSALSAPMFASIPATHRGVSDQILACTGTGRKGAAPEVPEYVPSRTTVFLMALHRLKSLVDDLCGNAKTGEKTGGKHGGTWPRSTPCAVIERASCPDQRVIRTTLEYVCAAVEEEGSRPPGLLVVGSSCEVLTGRGGRRWVVEEGFKEL